MQFLEGQTLKHRMAEKPLGSDEVLELGLPTIWQLAHFPELFARETFNACRSSMQF
jgi:hypothetical protein